MPTHYEETLQADLARIRGNVEQMASLAEGGLLACQRALPDRNRPLAYAVILRDQRIDSLEKEIDRLCLEFLVRQQPVARHLRFAYVTIKINQEVERIGDYAESIARQILKLSSLNVALPLDRYNEIANLAIPMFRDAVKAYLTEDAALARQLAVVEEEVDVLRNRLNAELVQMRQDNQIPLEALTPMMTIARRFERVSDQAKNICEETIYLVTGEYQKHASGGTWRVLFVDQNNSSLSQMAEAIGNSLRQPSFAFSSAGLTPQPLDGDTVNFMKGKGFDLSRASSGGMDKIPNVDAYQIMVALTPQSRQALPPKARLVCLDWVIADPSQSAGNSEEKKRVLEQTYQQLHDQINALVEGIISDKID